MTTSKKTGNGLFYGWVVVLVSAILTFLGTGFYSYSRGVFLPALAEELGGGSRFYIAMGFSLAIVTTASIAPFIGRVLDRHSARHVILTGVGLSTISYLALGWCQNLVQFYLVVGLGMGAGMACMGTLAWHRMVVSWFDHYRGRAIALAVLGASLAGVVMPPLVTELVQAVGWRYAYMIFAVIVVLTLTPLVLLFLKNRPEDIGEVRDGRRYVATLSKVTAPPEDSRTWHWRELLRYPAFWSISLMFGAMGCVFSAVMLHLFGHLTDIGISAQRAAIVLSATALFAALGKPVVGWMSDWFGARVTIWMALLVQALALVMFATATDFWLCILAGCTYGFGYSGMSPLRTFALSVAIGNQSFGTANGVLRVVELPLVISASPLAGYIYDSTGSYVNAFLILAGLMLVACVGPFLIRAGGALERRRLEAVV